MVRGFIFDGVDIDKIGLEYAPQMSQTFVHHSSTIKTHEETSDGHDGAYYYGETVQPKQFVLRCFFEDKFINSNLPMRIEAQFRRGRTGKLVFKERPWCYYWATVTRNVDFSDQKSYLNGIVTINLTAYYPFCRCDQYYIDGDNDVNKDNQLNSTGMFMFEANSGDVVDNQPGYLRSFNVVNGQMHHQYNPGTEVADVAVHITGNVGAGQTINNETTGQSMKILGLTANNISGKELVVDSLNGKSVIVNQTTGVVEGNGYIYHDGGFIQFAPCTPYYRDLKAIRTGNDGHTFEIEDGEYLLDKKITDGTYCAMVKKNGTWTFLTITGLSEDGKIVTVAENIVNYISSTNATDVTITRFNKITFQGTGMSDVTVSFEFKPTFA